MFPSIDWLLVSNMSDNLISPRSHGCPKMLVTTNLHYITSQKSRDLIYTTSETRNHSTTTWNYVDFKQFILHHFYNNDVYYGMYGLQITFVFTKSFSLKGSSRIRTCRRYNKTKYINSYLIMHTRISIVTCVIHYTIQTGNCTHLTTAHLYTMQSFTLHWWAPQHHCCSSSPDQDSFPPQTLILAEEYLLSHRTSNPVVPPSFCGWCDWPVLGTQ